MATATKQQTQEAKAQRPKVPPTYKELEHKLERVSKKNWNRRKALKGMNIAIMRDRETLIRASYNLRSADNTIDHLSKKLVEAEEASHGPARFIQGACVGLFFGVLICGLVLTIGI